MEVEIDIERLRQDLINYFGAAMSFYPAALIDLSKVEKASHQDLIDIALNNGFDINDYIVKDYSL